MISILTVATFTYSNGVVGATISNGTSYSIALFDPTTNSIGTSYSALTYSQVVNNPLLVSRLSNDSTQYGFEFYIQQYQLTYCNKFRVSYYKWDSANWRYDFYKNTLIEQKFEDYRYKEYFGYNQNTINGSQNSCTCTGFPCSCGYNVSFGFI